MSGMPGAGMMSRMGINTTEFIIIALILVIVVGPEKLPELAAQLGRLVREVKSIATGAKARVKEELGPDFEELKNLDPRQYDPRRIVQDALKDDPPSRVPSRTARPVSTPRNTTAAPAAAAAGVAGAGAVAANATPATSSTAAVTPPAQAQSEGTPAPSEEAVTVPAYTVPFDDQAT